MQTPDGEATENSEVTWAEQGAPIKYISLRAKKLRNKSATAPETKWGQTRGLLNHAQHFKSIAFETGKILVHKNHSRRS